MSNSSFKVAIIGAGFCGTMVAAQLLRRERGERPAEILLIDGISRRHGRGVAYSPFSEEHLLNVPAGAMGAFPDAPTDFHRWLLESGRQVEPGAFVPRTWYGEYLEALLAEAEKKAHFFKLTRTEAVVTSIKYIEGRFELSIDDGSKLSADATVVATGNLPQGLPVGGAELQHRALLVDPWKAAAVDGLGTEDPICILGTGLTAIDIILDLAKKGRKNPIVAISRRGRFPLSHSATPVPPISTPISFEGVNSARSVLRLLRDRVATDSWYAVIDSIRADTQSVWGDLSDSEKGRFIRHLRRYWDAHRHRVPSEVSSILDQLRESGQLRVVAGNIKSVEAVSSDIARVNFVPRGERIMKSIDVKRVINCTGPGASVERTENVLLQNLLCDAFLRKDALGLGVEVNPQSSGADRLFIIGPLLRGRLWETTAVRELRLQAADMGSRLGELIYG